MDVLNNLRTDVLVELTGQSAVLHHEGLLDDGGGKLDVEGLALDEDVGCVALDKRTHHHRPCRNKPVLIVWRLNTVDAHELHNSSIHPFRITLSHLLILNSQFSYRIFSTLGLPRILNSQFSILNSQFSITHLSPFHLKYLILSLRPFQNLVQMFPVRIRDEDLSEGITGH